MEEKKIQVDIIVPNQTRYLSLIGKIGEDIAKELYRYSGDRETLAYHINLVLTEAMAFWHREMVWEQVAMLISLVLALAATRVIAVRFSPRRLQQEL